MDPTKTRLVGAMRDALQRRGLHGVGLTEILQAAQAPKGVLYHHFPGGKTALAVAAVESVAADLGGALQALLQREADPVAALRLWMSSSLRRLEASGFDRGCPLATVALESTADDVELRQALASAFTAMRGHIAVALQRTGQSIESADSLAALIVATYEGGLLQARVAQDTAPLAQAMHALLDLLQRPSG